MSGKPRACRPEELDELVRLANQVFRSRGGDMAADYPLAFRAGNCEHLRVIDIDGRLVSHVGLSIKDAFTGGVGLRVASVGGVCTAPDQRGKGFASALMEDAAEHSRSHGAQLMLISGGRGLYHRLGYVTVGQFVRTAVGQAASLPLEADRQAGSLPHLDVSLFRPGDLPAVMALQRNERVRFVRPEADWTVLIEAGVLMNQPAELLVVRREGEPVAYLGVQKPTRDAEGRTRPARAVEIGGSRWAIAESVPQVLAAVGAETVQFVTHAADVEWNTLARARGWSAESAAFPGTLGILDPAAFMERLGTHIAERLGADHPLRIEASRAAVRFVLGNESCEVAAPGPLAALVFGGETDEARALPPLEGALGAALAELFPMPLLWYGYNYV